MKSYKCVVRKLVFVCFKKWVDKLYFMGNLSASSFKYVHCYLTDNNCIILTPCDHCVLVASNGAAHAQIQTYILEVRNRSSTSLFIRWAPPVNVSVDGYKIKLIYSDNGEQLFDVDGPFTDLIVSRLYRHSKYCVTVSVIIGETVGSESAPPLCAFTAIDGE